jgi:solute carrier family 25 (mitochondrial folate transporter), member 32
MRAAQRYKGVLHTCRVMLAEEGWRAFYAGIGVNLVRAVPAAMTTMLTYEYLQQAIQDLQTEGEALRKPPDAYPV